MCTREGREGVHPDHQRGQRGDPDEHVNGVHSGSLRGAGREGQTEELCREDNLEKRQIEYALLLSPGALGLIEDQPHNMYIHT